MAKGKNFNAAEKHFMKKEVVYRKRIKELEEMRVNDAKRLAEKAKEIKVLKENNQELQKLLDKALTYNDLSVEDVKTAIKQDEWLNQMHKKFATIVNGGLF